jgi:hypothetical protein
MINMKKNMPWVSAILAVISVFFSKYIVSKYGEDSRVIMITVVLVAAVVVVIGIIFTKKYLATFIVSMMMMPVVVGAIGIYIDNLYICAAGILLIFIIAPIMLKVINKRKGQF